jgi:two-component system response regulator VicR
MRVSKRILIVDDELGVREFLSESLQQRGYETSTAADGEEGLEQTERFQPDLILLDVMMPVMDGWKMLTNLRARDKTRNIPVVMLTAKSDTQALFKSEEHRVADYFIKPINIEELITFIKRYEGLKG